MPCTASYYLYWINIPDVTFTFFPLNVLFIYWFNVMFCRPIIHFL